MIQINNLDYYIDLPTSRLYIKAEEITESRIINDLPELKRSISFYRQYPDLFVDEVLKEPGSKFKLFPIQRIMLRVFARYRYIFATFNRGFSKSFIAILFEMLMCILYPGNHSGIVAGTAEQGAKIASSKIDELLQLIPRLKQEVFQTTRGKWYESTRDSVKVSFKNGSTLEVVGLLNSNRGLRKQQFLVEETLLLDGDKYNQVVVPMMSLSRKIAGFKSDDSEVHKRQVYITSAGFKSTFPYDKLVQILTWQAIKDDGTAFCLGGSYKLAEKMGLLEKTFRQELEEDGTFNEVIFEREFGSKWSGTADGSFFDAEDFDKCRKLTQANFSSDLDNNIKQGLGIYFMLSMDVGRLNDRSVVCVFKVTPDSGGGASLKSLVYMEQFEQEHFEIQSYKVKELIERYNAKVLVIDGNGLGAGLIDYLVRPTKDYDGKEVYPPYSVVNDDKHQYDKYIQDNSIPMIYNIKATAELNNAMAVNTLTQISSKKVHLLIDEKIAKLKMQQEIDEGKRKSLTSVERARKLKPHLLTSGLKEEMLNLRQKRNSEVNVFVTLEQVNRKLHKDKYSAFSYGLYWIKLQDDSRKKYKQANRFKSAMLYNTNNRWKK